MNYQKTIVVGNATKDAEQRKSKDGETTFTTFDVGVSDTKDKTTYFPIVVFGKREVEVCYRVGLAANTRCYAVVSTNAILLQSIDF